MPTENRTPTEMIALSVLSRSPRAGSFFRRLFSISVLLLLVSVRSALCDDPDPDPDGNPTGSSGSFNGASNTGGSFDPYTGNAKRVVTDVVVPGSNGAYPLQFTRIWNSRSGTIMSGDYSVFGVASRGWRHSYQWALSVSQSSASGTPITVYSVAYPEGGVVKFRNNRVQPTPADPFYRARPGISDRLEVPSQGLPILHLGDGGLVTFAAVAGGSIKAATIVDPYGATTLLTYDPSSGRLTQVTEPGGRFLKLKYGMAGSTMVLTSVTSSGTSDLASSGQRAKYGYLPYPGGYALTSVVYGEIAGDAVASSKPASYTYTNTSAAPELLTCDDSHFAGAMTHIAYTYKPAAGGVTGLVLSEQNPVSNPATTVATLSQNPIAPTGICTATVTRGDVDVNGSPIARMLQYGESQITVQGNAQSTGARPYQMTSATDYEGNFSHFFYSANPDGTHGKGFLSEILDRKGNPTLYETDPYNGKITKVTLPDGRVRQTVWTGSTASDVYQNSPIGKYYLFQTIDERNQATVYHRDATTHLVNSIDYPTGTESFTYQTFTGVGGHNFYKIRTRATRLGAVITYTYDTSGGGSGYLGNLIGVSTSWAYSGPNGNEVGSDSSTITLDSLDRPKKIIDGRGVSATIKYNSQNRPVTVQSSDANSAVTRAYDPYGNLMSVTNELGKTTAFSYDDYRRLVKQVDPIDTASGLYAKTFFTYDRRKADFSVASSALSTTSSAPSQVLDSAGNARLYVYTPNGNVATAFRGLTWSGSSSDLNAAPNGNASVNRTYDEEDFKYDANDLLKRGTDWAGDPWAYTYDNCNRLSTATDGLGHVYSKAYYLSGPYIGWLQSTTAPGNNAGNTSTVTYSSYNQLGEPLTAVDSSNTQFSMAYDAEGNLSQQSDGRTATGDVSMYNHDTRGRLRQVLFPNGDSEQYTYDASGNVASFTDRMGDVKTLTYDLRNHLKHSEWSNNADTPEDYGYDDAENLISASNWWSALGFTYDDRNLLQTESQNIAGTTAGPQTVTYTRRKDGLVTFVRYPSGKVLQYSYTSSDKCFDLAGYSHLAWVGDQLTNRTLSNFVITSFSNFQANGRVNSELTFLSGPNTDTAVRNISARNYGYYPNGQLSWYSKTDPVSGSPNRGDAYYYLIDGRMQSSYHGAAGLPAPNTAQTDSIPGDSSVAVPSVYDHSRSVGLDGADNPTSQSIDGVSMANGFDAENRWAGLGYDGNGNTTSTPEGWSYHYLASGMLQSANGPNGAHAEFTRDPLGRMCTRLLPGQSTDNESCFLYAGAQRIEERQGASLQSKYQYFYDAPGDSSIVARQDASSGNLLYYTYDASGNTTHVTDASGNVVEEYYYDSYGLPYVLDGSGNPVSGNQSACDNRFMWNGQSGYEWLPSLGYYHIGARDYRPDLGRFLQPDPAGQDGGLNLYAYCGNDPVNRADPSGLYPIVTISNDSGGLTGGPGGFTGTPNGMGGVNGDPSGVDGGTNVPDAGSGGYFADGGFLPRVIVTGTVPGFQSQQGGGTSLGTLFGEGLRDLSSFGEGIGKTLLYALSDPSHGAFDTLRSLYGFAKADSAFNEDPQAFLSNVGVQFNNLLNHPDEIAGLIGSALPNVEAGILTGGIASGAAIDGSSSVAQATENATDIFFKTEHALPHFVGTDLSQAEIESQIGTTLRGELERGVSVEGSFGGRLDFNGVTIEYRGYGLPNGTISVGTYFPDP